MGLITITGCAQLLVTPRDFRDPSFKANLRETTEELLNMARVVPVFNENDAISDRTRVRPLHNFKRGHCSGTHEQRKHEVHACLFCNQCPAYRRAK